MSKHTHNIGVGMRCTVEGCTYVLRIRPISFSVEVFDRRVELYSEHFNCDTIDGAIDGLEQAADALRKSAGLLMARSKYIGTLHGNQEI